MGGADGAGQTSSASAAVDHLNWRRTPITSDGTNNHGYWLQKEAEYNLLDPRAQAQFSYGVMPTASILEKDWNHLQEIPIQGLEHTPFKELIRIYPKDIESKRAYFMAGPRDFGSMRRLYGDPTARAFMTGPVFADTHVEDIMFNELFVQLTLTDMRKSPDPNARSSHSKSVYDNRNLRQMMDDLNAGAEFYPPLPESSLMVSPGLNVPHINVHHPPPVYNQPNLAGNADQLEVGHFVAPVIQHEPHHRAAPPPRANNIHHQVSRHLDRYRINQNYNQRGRYQRGGFVNNRCQNDRQRFEQQQRNRNARSSSSSNARASTPVVVRQPTPSSSEHRREQVVPIEVVVVDRQNEANAANINREGYYHFTSGYRQWRGQRFNHGNNDKNTPNKIHFNRKL